MVTSLSLSLWPPLSPTQTMLLRPPPTTTQPESQITLGFTKTFGVVMSRNEDSSSSQFQPKCAGSVSTSKLQPPRKLKTKSSGRGELGRTTPRRQTLHATIAATTRQPQQRKAKRSDGKGDIKRGFLL